MDLQKKNQPPRIPNTPQPPQIPTTPPSVNAIPVQAQSNITLAAVGSLLLGIFSLITWGDTFTTILSFAGDLGFEFLFKFMLSSNAMILFMILAVVGAVALFMKNKWGWPIAFGAATFNIFTTIFSIIMTMNSPFAWRVYGTTWQILLFYLGFFISIGVVVILSLPATSSALKVDANQRLIGFGLLGFLALDIIVCYFLF